MAPLVIEGETLGEKHQSYNKIINDAIKTNVTPDIPGINYEESDLDNLFKIDLASSNKNVEYILEILKSEDMLYVSRAIKRSTWLITDPQYAHIINPNYLSDQLFPQMTSKAIQKLILHIRLNLKDEKRVEEFFNFYKDKDLKASFKWLFNCSIPFVENIIEKHLTDICNSSQLMRRLCEKSISYLELFCRHSMSYFTREVLSSTKFFLNDNADKYLDIVERNVNFDIPHFNAKFTKILMTKCGDRIKKNLEKYLEFIHLPTFAKYIRKEEMKDFIIENIKNKNLRSLFEYKKIKPFINRLPRENRFELIKEIFIQKKYSDDDVYDRSEVEPEVEYLYDDCEMQFCSADIKEPSTSRNIYNWYIYAEFKTAFTDLKKIIRTESRPAERIAMLGVILYCANKNMRDVQTLLKFYRENHINEPFKFKIQFVNLVISKTDTHKFDKITWGYLNDLFNSMEVYSESDNNVQSCIKSIILYNITHDERIPEIVQKKFEFDTLKNYQKKFTQDEKEKIFSYLYKLITLKLDNDIQDFKQFTDTVDLLETILRLLSDWNKELGNFPKIVDKIREIINIKKMKSWNHDISKLYNVKKSWKRLLFAESIILSPNQDVCINALKHGPELLETYKQEVEVICTTKNTPTNRFLKKIRIYWSESLANCYKETFKKNLDEITNHKALIVALCYLLPQSELLSLAQKFAPAQAKIDWDQLNELELSLSKHVASSLHLARPQPSLETALMYAKGDYLQYALPFLNAILHNMSCDYTRQHIKNLLDAPVSLQKHGIRISFVKLKYHELKQIFSDIWNSSKNSSIRTDIFIQTFKMLCKERDSEVVKEIWGLLSDFIDNLTTDENKNIYTTLGKAENVPMSVRPEFLMKSYTFLNSLPAKANCNNLVSHLKRNMVNVMEFLDDDFMISIFMESLESKFSTKEYEHSYLVATFVLSCKTEDKQMQRYSKVYVKILNLAFTMWDKTHNDNYFVRFNVKNMFAYLCDNFCDIVLEKQMIVPIAMFTDLLDRLQKNLLVNKNYGLLTSCKLALDFIKILDGILKVKKDIVFDSESNKNVDEDDKKKALYKEAVPKFGEVCLQHLKSDIESYFPSIYIVYAETLETVFSKFKFTTTHQLETLKCFLADKDFITGHIFVLQILPTYLYSDDDKALKKELMNDIQSHPAEEVKMHYWHYQRKNMHY